MILKKISVLAALALSASMAYAGPGLVVSCPASHLFDLKVGSNTFGLQHTQSTAEGEKKVFETAVGSGVEKLLEKLDKEVAVVSFKNADGTRPRITLRGLSTSVDVGTVGKLYIVNKGLSVKDFERKVDISLEIVQSTRSIVRLHDSDCRLEGAEVSDRAAAFSEAGWEAAFL